MNAHAARDLWLAELETQGCSTKTIALYRSHAGEALETIAAQSSKAKAGLELEMIDRDGIVKAVSAYRARPDRRSGEQASREGASVSSFFGAMRSFLSWCVETERLQRSPALTIKPPKIPARVPKALPLEVCRAVIEAADRTRQPERDGLAVRLAMMAGLRLSEIAGLQLNSFHPNIASPTHVRAIGKGNKERSVPLAPAVIEALARYLPARDEIARRCQVESDLLLLGRPRSGVARGLTRDGLGQMFDQVVIAAGAKSPGIRAHMARHSFATHLLSSGVADIMEVKELLGHASVATTQVYLKVDPTRLTQSVQRSPLAAL